MHNCVLVVDSNQQPLMPCHPARARQLLRNGKAAVLRMAPFTIILKEREGGATQATELKLDPGSKTTGIAVVITGEQSKRVVWAAELHHRGERITHALDQRRAVRRSRHYIRHRTRQQRVRGFQTGDLVLAVVPRGKHQGTHVGRVVVRTTGSFRVGTRDGISYQYCTIVQRTDGYEYGFGSGLKPLKRGASSQGSSSWASAPEGKQP